MAWLADEQWAMIEDSIEKKNIARSASHRRGHCGKRGGVKLPSDYMTKKEIKSMSSNVISYNLNRPMNWETFKSMPEDLKIEYIKRLRDMFSVPNKVIAQYMFGVSNPYISNVFSGLGLALGKAAGGSGKRWYESEDSKKFYEWFGINPQEDTQDSSESPEKTEEEMINIYENTHGIETVDDIKVSEVPRIIPTNGELNFYGTIDDIFNVLHPILSGTKIHMKINWEIEPATKNTRKYLTYRDYKKG